VVDSDLAEFLDLVDTMRVHSQILFDRPTVPVFGFVTPALIEQFAAPCSR
jgi:hypothetical protein